MLLFLIIYLERIIATEEEFLAGKFGDAYRDWATEVPAFFPRLTGWRAPELPFSFRNVLRREYSGPFRRHRGLLRARPVARISG